MRSSACFSTCVFLVCVSCVCVSVCVCTCVCVCVRACQKHYKNVGTPELPPSGIVETRSVQKKQNLLTHLCYLCALLVCVTCVRVCVLCVKGVCVCVVCIGVQE